MNDEPIRVVHFSEIPPDQTHRHIRYPVREHLGVAAFGVNLFRAEQPGDGLIEEHTEVDPGSEGHEELYFVVSGGARFIVNGVEHEVTAGAFVFVRDPEVTRAATATQGGTTILAVGGPHGRAFRVAPWEFSSLGVRCLLAEDWQGARAALEEGLATYPEDGAIHYNLACLEARIGDLDAAMRLLLRAVELDPQVVEWAQDDTDLDPLRLDPRFPALEQ